MVAAHVVAGSSAPAEAGFTIAFAISAVGVAAAFCATLAIPARLPYAARPPDGAAAAVEAQLAVPGEA